MSRAKVFVYGTLKDGGPLHPLLRRNMAEFVGYDYIDRNWEFVDCGAFPAAHSGYNRNRIYGEVYKISHECMACLDMAEGHPTLFRRIKTRTSHGDRSVWVYILNSNYVRDKYVDILKSGIWSPSKDELNYWDREGKSPNYAKEATDA